MTGEASSTLRLAEILDLNAAAPLRADLLQRRGSDLTLDASPVQRIGGQCLQVLLAASDAWGIDGHSLTLTSIPPAVEETLRRMGAGHLITSASHEVLP